MVTFYSATTELLSHSTGTYSAMASGKKSALLSSLADYGDDSEPDSDPEVEEAGRCSFIYQPG